jgi:DNA-binding CsgD family transcriptional regulator
MKNYSLIKEQTQADVLLGGQQVNGTGGPAMNDRRRFTIRRRDEKGFSVHPKAFIFVDKRTGAQRFEVKANADGSIPIDEAVSLLVVHCLMRNQGPNDFEVMVSAGENLLDGLRPRARKLIHACPLIQASLQLTNRQQQVFRGVQQGLSNKEIGKKVNLSERAVKFHVSALLVKFDVAGRMGLVRKAADLLSAERIPASVELPRLDTVGGQGAGQEIRISRENLVQVNALERRSRG